MMIPSLKEYIRSYPNPRLEELNNTIGRLYDYYGNMVEMNPVARYGMEIACDTSKPYSMRSDGLNLAEKILRKVEARQKRERRQEEETRKRQLRTDTNQPIVTLVGRERERNKFMNL